MRLLQRSAKQHAHSLQAARARLTFARSASPSISGDSKVRADYRITSAQSLATVLPRAPPPALSRAREEVGNALQLQLA